MANSAEKVHSKLDEFSSTAIAGNDILSSCLYVSGIAILFAGVLAPLVFLAVALVLFLYKHVYTEVVEALPLNGGAYNCLLNAASKPLAAIAGVMTVLSYVATVVISAKTASEYFHTVITGLPILLLTVTIILFFMFLTILGVRDSARVAKLIFIIHIAVLTVFISVGAFTIFRTGFGQIPFNLMETQKAFASQGTLKLLFFAFAASLLGVSGFESSANFVEEQKPGVFRKTLRNMLTGILIFNPLITFVVLISLPLPQIVGAKDFVLAESAHQIGGSALQYMIVADAFLVLCGAVLAGFVGATGLLYRMTLDHCLPSTILLPKLRQRGKDATRIVVGFALLCLSILSLTRGNLLSLAGVYTISFLGVMTLFAIGNIILRKTRTDLRRPYKGPIIAAVLAGLATLFGIVGNIMIDPQNMLYFLLYFLPAVAIVTFMIYRDYILEWMLMFLKIIPPLQRLLEPWFLHVIRPRILLFAHHPHKLYLALEYIRKNETSRNITVIFCREKDEESRMLLDKFRRYITTFKEASVFPHLNIELLVEDELEFGPEVVKQYVGRFKTLTNNVFIGSIHDTHAFSFEELGGVRIIQ